MDETAQSEAQKVGQLVARLQASFGISDTGSNESQESLRYVIYARKSTDVAEKQERSIGDQIGECKGLADRLGPRWVEVIHEEKSAMVADKRPLFRAMLEKLRAGTIDGIIAWAPDRLARNMKEGGEIIDMLDHGVIKDIKFANGKCGSAKTSLILQTQNHLHAEGGLVVTSPGVEPGLQA